MTPLGKSGFLSLAAAFLIANPHVFGQGSLTPTGTPGPTMKTLDQVEARTALPSGTLSAPYQITAPGSYYLTGNITVANDTAITVNADQVTLDLNGFTIFNTSTSTPLGSGVLVNGARSNVTIHNGHIQSSATLSTGTFTNTGFFNGIFTSNTAHNVRVERISVQGVQRGVHLQMSDNSGSVSDCKVAVANTSGINAATIKNSTAIDCGGAAITGRTVSDCYGASLTNNGINADSVLNCEGVSAGSASALVGITVQNCVGINSSGGTGLSAGTATNCRGTSVSGNGVTATIANTCSGQTTSGIGLSANIAVSCVGTATGGGTATSIGNRYNMP